MAIRIVSQQLLDALVRAGIIENPSYVRRVVIDIEVGEAPKVYVEKFGEDHQLVDVIESVGIEIKQAELSPAS